MPSAFELLMSAPDDQTTRCRLAHAAIGAGDWADPAHFLRNAAREPASPPEAPGARTPPRWPASARRVAARMSGDAMIHFADVGVIGPVGPRFAVLGVTDDRDFCQCCGREGLKRVVWIEGGESGAVRHFGTTCATAPAKGFGVATAVKAAIARFDDAQRLFWTQVNAE